MGGAAPPEKHQRGCPADRCVAWCTHPRPTPTTALHCRRALHEPPCDALGPQPHTFRPEKAMRCDGRCSALRGHMQRTAMAYAAHCAICPGSPPQEPHGISTPSLAPRNGKCCAMTTTTQHFPLPKEESRALSRQALPVHPGSHARLGTEHLVEVGMGREAAL